MTNDTTEKKHYFALHIIKKYVINSFPNQSYIIKHCVMNVCSVVHYYMQQYVCLFSEHPNTKHVRKPIILTTGMTC